MDETNWILLDTETTGFTAPIFVVEFAAQRMRGWEPEGEPFRKLLNHNRDIPPEASAVHGYTREILERDGEPPLDVYRDFAGYAADLPVVSFNLAYDFDEVLLPEWNRLRLAPIGTRGFCALRLAQRLLDPVPAGNCKLQTVRQYYRLPERGAHSAFGDVQTVADLFLHVLRPIADHRGLETWEKLAAYAAEEWYPSRLAFGKFQGRVFQEARKDAEFRRWLEWLAASSSARSAKMGRWYLRQLKAEPQSTSTGNPLAAPKAEVGGKPVHSKIETTAASLVLYENPEIEQLRQLVADARARLAELDSDYTREKSKVDVMQADLFRRLREDYQRRDRLRLIVEYRRKYLDGLLRGGEEEAKQAEANYQKARGQSDREYEEAAVAVAKRKQLTADEEAELARLWKKLVKLYHPDRFADEPDRLETYHKLTSAINRAKGAGDIATLREIADDPEGFILRQGWTGLDFSDEIELKQLRRLYESLQLEIINVLESLVRLRESPDYELCQLSAKKPGLLDELAAERAKLLEAESSDLQKQAERFADEIKELGGDEPRII